MRMLWTVFAALVVLVVLAVFAKVFYSGGGWGGLASPALGVRPWAEAEYNAVMAPVATAGKGTEPRFGVRMSSVVRTEDEADPTKLRLEMVSEGEAEAWTPAYRVRVVDEAGGFGFVDGERSGKVEWVGARTMAREFMGEEEGRSGALALAFFSPAMEPLDEAGMEEAGVAGHDRHVWVQTNQPATGVKLRLEVTGYDDVKWQLRGFYDRETKVKLATGGGWTSTGGTGRFESDLTCLHDAKVRLVADFCHGPVERYPLVPGDGESVEGDAFRVEIVALVNGKSRGSGSSGSGGKTTHHYQVDDVGGDETLAVFAITPAVADDALTIEAFGKDGRPLRSSLSSSSGSVRNTGWGAKPGEIERFEIVYRPNYERLLIDLPPLCGVPEANVGVGNLFDCVVPLGEIDGEWELRRLIGEAVQLEIKGVSSTRSGGMKGFFPLEVSGMTVGEVVGMYSRERPELRFGVDPVGMRLEISEPGMVPWWKRAWDSVGGWF